jgi:DNA recombination protein RmuC
LVGLICLVAGLGIGFAAGRAGRRPGGAADLTAVTDLTRARTFADALSRENAQLREQAERDQAALRQLGPIQPTLEQIRAQVASLELDRAKQYAALAEQMSYAQQTDQALRASTQALENSLRSSSARGTWGELQLRRVLELSGLDPHISFEEQRTEVGVDGGRVRPDVTIALPGGKFLAIDAKAPMDAYLRASQPGADQTAELAAHAKALRVSVDALAKRQYPASLGSAPDFTILFLPMEPLLSSALEADPALMDHALGHGVVPATPSSLLALLKTVAVIWRQATVEEQARELHALGADLYQRLGVLASHVTKVGSGLASTVKSFNQLVGSVEGRLLVTARRFEGFDVSQLKVEAIDADSAQVRDVMAPELTTPDEGGAPPMTRRDLPEPVNPWEVTGQSGEKVSTDD